MPDRWTHSMDGRRAFAHFACWLCLLAPAAVVLLILIQQGSLLRLAGPATFALTGGAGLWLLRRGRHEAAYRVLIFGSWLATLVALSYTGGAKGNAAAALPIIIVFSAWLAGIRTMLILGGATIAALFGFTWLELNSLLSIRIEPPIAQRAFILSVIVVGATALGYYAARTLTAQMDALQASRRDLQDKIATLTRREQELSLITERVPAMIARFDRNRICRFANSAYADFVGQARAALPGRHIKDIIGPSAYADIASGIERVLGGEPVRQTVSRSNAEGSVRTLALDLVPDIGPRGEAEGWYALIRDVTDRERAAKALRHIVDGTASPTGTAFFRALTQNMAQATGLGRAMVAEISADGRHARTLSHWDGKEFRQDMVYLLEDAPCKEVLERGEACFTDGVADLFPRDLALAMNGIRGYYGARLDSADKKPLGVLVVMDSAPIRNRAGIASLVRVFAARAAAELERLRAEDVMRTALERFEAIFQNTPNVAIQGYDARGTVMHWNRASEKLYGIPAAEALGHPLQELLFVTPEAVREFESIVAGICASGKPSEPGEWPMPLRDGREIWVMSTMFPVLSDGAVIEVFCMDVDITALKQASESVRRLNVELEERVAVRTAELNELNRELEVFSYSVSHDLRAPLRSIEGFGRMLLQEYAGKLDANGQDYVNRMCRAAKRLALLIDDLLELTRIDRAEIKPVDLDLTALALDIIDELRRGTPRREASFVITPGLAARGDAQLVRVALQNLLDNAWKYTGKTDGARIEFDCEVHSGERVFHLRDNGAGFDMAYADKLFAPFQRLHSPHEFEGTGVGLASVARVIRRHGGRIWAKAAPGRGATFYFTLE